MKEPLISIIVPAYNVEKYINKCMDSLINQSYINIEIICVNNGSVDKTLEILRMYSEKDNRVKVISQDNQGVSMARNAALDFVKGDYIMFVDSDDWIETKTCEIAVNTASEYDADVIIWDYIREFADSSKPKNIFDTDIVFEKAEVKNKLHRRMIGIVDEELVAPENADALCTIWGKFYKRSCIFKDNIRFYDIRKIGTYEDGLFNLDVFLHVKRAVYIHQHLYHYRKDNTDSITTRYQPDLIEKHERIHEYMQKYIHDNNLNKKYTEALNNRKALELVGYGLNILHKPSGRLSEIRRIIKDDNYHSAYRRLKMNYFPIYWRVFYSFAKYKCALGVYALLICIRKIIGN